MPPSFTEELLAHTVREATALAESHINAAARTHDPAVQACIGRVRDDLDSYRAAAGGQFDPARFGAAFERLQQSLDALRAEWTRCVRGARHA